MKGRIVKDWSVVDIQNPESRKLVFGALQHFCDVPLKPEFVAAAQHFASHGDFPDSVLAVLKQYQLQDMYDDAWTSVFDVLDFTGSNRNGFEILDVEDGLTFAEVPIGEKAKVYKFGGVKAQVTFAMYGAGLGWHRRLFDDREYWTIERNAVAFRNKAYKKRSETAYALIDAVPSAQNLAWQAVVPANLPNTDANYVAIRDMQTINAACMNILTACKDKGYNLSVNSQFVLLAPYQLRSRIQRALGVINAGISGGLNGVPWSITPRFALGLSDSTKYYVALPKEKTIFADRMNLQVFDQFDPTSYSDVAVGWMRFGGCIGDTAQFQRCATA